MLAEHSLVPGLASSPRLDETKLVAPETQLGLRLHLISSLPALGSGHWTAGLERDLFRPDDLQRLF